MNKNNRQQNVTYLDELPELEDIEKYQQYNIYTKSGGNTPVQPNVSKFIRSSGKMFHENSGMNYNIKENHNRENHNRENYKELEEKYKEERYEEKYIRERYDKEEEERKEKMRTCNISCIEISKHIKECPVCSQLYNNDKTIYLIIIFLLSIVCLILLKKILHI